MDISVIIPLYNEEESLRELYEWIKRVMDENNFTYEIIFVDDGSTDGSWNIITELKENRNIYMQSSFVVIMENRRHCNALFKSPRDVVITMDADLQDSPDEIPELYRMIKEEGYDLVSGWKKRYDSILTKNLPSKLFNATARCVSGIKLHDFNCGLKAYRKDVVKNIELYNEMHRYIPVLVKSAGFTKIGEKPVQHQPRKYGKSKFGASRFFNGYLDLMTLWFLNRFGKKPMHFFGVLGTLMFFIGFVAVIIVGATKLYDMHHGNPYRLVTESPYFYIS